MSQGARSFVAAALLVASLGGCNDAPTPPLRLYVAGGDPQRGKALIYDYGCGTCHTIEDVRGAYGTVGPPLSDYAKRNVLAGILPNTPRTLVAWIMDPPAIVPRTAMPNMGITEAQARDIASFLYTLGAADAQVYPSDPPLALKGYTDPPVQSGVGDDVDQARRGVSLTADPIDRALELLSRDD